MTRQRLVPPPSMAAIPATGGARVQAAEGAARQRGRSEAESLDAREPGATLAAPREVDIDGLLKRLHLANARRVWRDLVARAEKEQWSVRDFLVVLIAEEVAQRQQTRVQRLSRRAGFTWPLQSPTALSRTASTRSSSPPPNSSTTSRRASAVATSPTVSRYVAPHVLVVDEVGYLTYGTDAANMLYHVVNDRHRLRRSMVFTSNKHPDAWGSVLHDDDLAQAIVDRVLERGRLLKLDGPSIRTKHLGLDAPASAEAGSQQVVKISGISSPEFPEPTRASSRRSVETSSTLLRIARHRTNGRAGDP